MKVLLSIRPEYAEKILTGEKRYEFRRCIPKTPGISTVVIYATLPVGKVVGEFKVERILSERPNELWAKTKEYAGITRDFFEQYFSGRDHGHAFEVRSTKRYGKPKPLTRFLENGIAPQSFCYLN
ncbi:MAG: ASCH domain-containing protein [Proteobacteria bacterium]|nr:ASCH domain-containing protein [Pseudomonadota bacterium]